MVVEASRRRAALSTACLITALACATPLLAQDRPAAAATADDPTPDAIIEKWHETWTLHSDGTIVYEESRTVRLHNDRAYGALADPRIRFNQQTDTVEVLVARTTTADGRVVEVPDYARNEVSPGATAGWPVLADIRELVLTMGGLEPDCLVELAYSVTSRGESERIFSATTRLDHAYPVRERVITLTLPAGRPLAVALSGQAAAADSRQPPETTDRGMSTRTYRFGPLPANPEESHAPPASVRGMHFSFSSLPDEQRWVAMRLAAVESAARETPAISERAREWAGSQPLITDKLTALHDRLAARFNFVGAGPSHRPFMPRSIDEAFASGYGLPEETAALSLALARAAGVALRPALLVSDDVWQPAAPQDALVDDYVFLFDDAGHARIWHPQHGLIRRDARWAGRTIIHLQDDKIARIHLPAYTKAGESLCTLRGAVKIGDDGKLSGKLSLSVSGVFTAPGGLDSAERQKQRVAELVRLVLPDAEVADYTPTTLRDDAFSAELDVTSDALPKLDGNWRLTLGELGLHRSEVSMPLGTARRKADVRLAAPFEEQLDLVISWPAGWTVTHAPAAAGLEDGSTFARQEVTAGENQLTVRRNIRVDSRDMTPVQFAPLREMLNAIRAPAARNLLLKP